MKNLFIRSGYLHDPIIIMANGERFDLSQLPPFLRVLLTTDGTVTKSLESYFWEPVSVHCTYQGGEKLSENAFAIDKHKGEPVLARHVMLQGMHSKRCFVRAESYIAAECLPEQMRTALKEERMGIGELLRDSGLETYRELMAFGMLYEGEREELWRTYRIMLGHKPCMQITERFDVALFRVS